MTAITFQDGTVQVDATIVAAGLKITPEVLRTRMREGRVTSRFERGEAEDMGRYRVTFLSESRRLRLTIDASGTILHQSAADIGNSIRPG